MPLTVEDGTLVAGADSYVSLADANTYWDGNGAPTAWTSLTDQAKEGRLRAAARYLQDGQRLPFTGTLHAWDQALVWPRVGATNYGTAVPSDAVPGQVIDAQLWLTVYGLGTGALTGTPGTPATNGNLRSQQLGPIARSFFSPKEMAEGQAAASNSAPADLVGLQPSLWLALPLAAWVGGASARERSMILSSSPRSSQTPRHCGQ